MALASALGEDVYINKKKKINKIKRLMGPLAANTKCKVTL